MLFRSEDPIEICIDQSHQTVRTRTLRFVFPRDWPRGLEDQQATRRIPSGDNGAFHQRTASDFLDADPGGDRKRNAVDNPGFALWLNCRPGRPNQDHVKQQDKPNRRSYRPEHKQFPPNQFKENVLIPFIITDVRGQSGCVRNKLRIDCGLSSSVGRTAVLSTLRTSAHDPQPRATRDSRIRSAIASLPSFSPLQTTHFPRGSKPK